MPSGPEEADILSRVQGVLENVLKTSIRTWPIDQPLGDAPGVVYDSVTRVETVFAIEEEFGLQVAAVIPENLMSVSALVDLVGRAKKTEG